MAVITRIETQKHDPERVNIYLDDAFSVGVSTMILLSRRLSEGSELTEEDLEELRREDEIERAYGAALNFLSFRPRSRREIEDYCRRRKVSAEATQGVVSRLERAGLLDDREFARFWVENRQAFRPRGSRALKLELWGKGVEREVIEGALADLPDEEGAAYEAGRKRLSTYARLPEQEYRRKMIAFLMRRGFPYDAANAATKRLRLDATGEASPDDVEQT